MKFDLKSLMQHAGKSAKHITRSITGRDELGNEVVQEKLDLSNPTKLLTSPAAAIRTVKDELFGVLFFVAVIWAVYWGDTFIPFINLNEIAPLIPRTLRGLPGIFTMTFLHGGIRHLIQNTIPLIVLLTLLAGSRGRSWLIVLSIMLLSGSLLWLFGRNGTDEHVIHHVGASGLVMGLITFLIASACIERRIVPMVIAVVVGLLFGSNLIFGFWPAPGVSWDGHLCGALAGVIVAFGCAQAWFTKEVLGLRKELVIKQKT
jgi:membrane associated rhomboid family serine protease